MFFNFIHFRLKCSANCDCVKCNRTISALSRRIPKNSFGRNDLGFYCFSAKSLVMLKSSRDANVRCRCDGFWWTTLITYVISKGWPLIYEQFDLKCNQAFWWWIYPLRTILTTNNLRWFIWLIRRKGDVCMCAQLIMMLNGLQTKLYFDSMSHYINQWRGDSMIRWRGTFWFYSRLIMGS